MEPRKATAGHVIYTGAQKKTKWNPGTILRNLIPFMTAVLFIIPLIWMFFVSLKKQGSGIGNVLQWFAPPYTFENYVHVIMDTDVLRWLVNSLIVGIITTLVTLIVTSLAAFAISQIQFSYKKFIFVFFLAGMMVPGEATIIPLYQIVKDLNLLDSYAGLILPGIASPLGVIILKSFFDGVPKEVIESAKMDGCSLFKIYYKIVVPLAKPAIPHPSRFLLSSVPGITFCGPIWRFSRKICIRFQSVSQHSILNYSQDYIVPMTVNAVASIPVIIAFFFFEKQIVKGISFTGIKG